MTISKHNFKGNSLKPDPEAVANLIRNNNEFGSGFTTIKRAAEFISETAATGAETVDAARAILCAAAAVLHLSGCLPKPAITGGLTKAQHKTLMVIRDYIDRHGFSPSYDEIRDALELSSKSGVHRLISALKVRGYVSSSGGVRDLCITPAGAAVSNGVRNGEE